LVSELLPDGGRRAAVCLAALCLLLLLLLLLPPVCVHRDGGMLIVNHLLRGPGRDAAQEAGPALGAGVPGAAAALSCPGGGITAGRHCHRHVTPAAAPLTIGLDGHRHCAAACWRRGVHGAAGGRREKGGGGGAVPATAGVAQPQRQQAPAATAGVGPCARCCLPGAWHPGGVWGPAAATPLPHAAPCASQGGRSPHLENV